MIIYIYTCGYTYTYTCIHGYIHIFVERKYISIHSIFFYGYIYIYIERERERERERRVPGENVGPGKLLNNQLTIDRQDI